MSGIEADVVIIGAGAAGLAAAHKLSAQTLSVCVLEARDRVGGRIHTLHQGSHTQPIELGAEFIHGKPPEVFEILHAAKLNSVEVTGEKWCADEGQLRPCAETDALRLGAAEEESILRRIDRRSADDKSLGEFLDQCCQGGDFTAAQAAAVAQYVEGFHAAQTERISVQALAHTEDAAGKIEGDKSFRLPGGYDGVVDWLRISAEKGGAALHLNTVVETVRWRKRHVEVVTRNSANMLPQTYTARCAIVTLPLGVLQAPPGATGAVCFVPELSEKQAALGKLVMGQATRVTLRFREQWWAERTQQSALQQGNGEPPPIGFIFSRDQWMPTWWTTLPMQAPVLVGWAGGPKAEKLSLKDKSFVVDTAIKALARVFGVTDEFITDQLEEAYLHDWQADPFARGSYSYVAVGGVAAQVALARPVEDTLFFAGEATNCDGHAATVHGSIATGMRAAAEIIKSLTKENQQ